MSDKTIPDPSDHMDDPVKALYHAMGQEYQIVIGRIQSGEKAFVIEVHTEGVPHLRDLVAGHFGKVVRFSDITADRSRMEVSE